jgi:hypothetical protein
MEWSHLPQRAEAIIRFHEVGIFNSGEELVLDLNVSPAVGVGRSAQVTVTTNNAVSAFTLVGTRNTPTPTVNPD